MKKLPVVLVVLFAILGGTYLGFQRYTEKVMDRITLQVTPAPTRPSAIGLKYRELTLTQRGRTVKAWIVTAPGKSRAHPVVVLFNGRGDNRSEWLCFQQYLASNGIASVSFDYGPLADTLCPQGSSHLAQVGGDVKTILDTLQLLHPKTENVFLLAHSVGNAVMLQLYPAIDSPLIKGVIICNAFASMKQWSEQRGQLSPLVAALFPVYYDNTVGVQRVTQPILLLHSRNDRVNLFSDAQALYAAIKSPKIFITFDHYGHNDLYKPHMLPYWGPIVHFINAHSAK